MTVPVMVRIGALVVATTAFYAYVGQMVPQKEVQPPAEIVLKTDLTTAEMAKVGREIMEGKGLCLTCHTIGKTGALRFPDLAGVAVRAKTRVAGLSDIPVLGKLFAHSKRETQETDIVLTLTPRLVRVLDPSESDVRAFKVGRDGDGGGPLELPIPAALPPPAVPPAAAPPAGAPPAGAPPAGGVAPILPPATGPNPPPGK